MSNEKAMVALELILDICASERGVIAGRAHIEELGETVRAALTQQPESEPIGALNILQDAVDLLQAEDGCIEQGSPFHRRVESFLDSMRRYASPQPTQQPESEPVKFTCHGNSSPAYSCNKPGDMSGTYYRCPQPAPQVPELTPRMLKAIQTKTEIGEYVCSEWAGAYDLLQELWTVANAAAPPAGGE